MLYLSQAIGRPVLDAHGEPIGKVDDLIVQSISVSKEALVLQLGLKLTIR